MNFERLLTPVASFLDRRIGWNKLPRPLGILALIGLREQLREHNLTDTGLIKSAPPLPPDLTVRTFDGGWNDRARPAMGSVHTRFGRNVPLDRVYQESQPELLEPSPRVISCELLARKRFIPAESLNLLAAAWIQFEVHDWLSHDIYPDHDLQHRFSLNLEDDSEWPYATMEIPHTKPDPLSPDHGWPPVFATHDTHWWDGSQIYGCDERFNRDARTHSDGKLRIDEDGLQPSDLDPRLDPKGPRGNFWVGLALLHALFIQEHNAICDALRAGERRKWTDDELHDKARLINAAVMAKIHSVEWTPAVIAHPTTEWAMKVNWYGLLGKKVREHLGRIGRGDVLSGIRGSPTNHHGAPYSLTEEFVCVYRMHPLIPDEYEFWPLDGGAARRLSFADIGPRKWRIPLVELGMANALYSFGLANPGAIVLHNYPDSLRTKFQPDEDGPLVDLATIDVLRDRERGVPRYNEFRTLMHRTPVASFEELAGDSSVAKELEAIYGYIDRVDTMVGLYAEARPRGFAFGDTAFRIFLLMASRRLKSDRFFTVDYTPEVYTATGLKWIDDATMSKVILRHYPALGRVIRHDNAFKPWYGDP